MILLKSLIYLISTLGLVAAQNATSKTETGGNSTSGSNETLRVGPIDFAGYNNYAYRDNVTACQVVISK